VPITLSADNVEHPPLRRDILDPDASRSRDIGELATVRWGLRPQPPPTVINVGEGLVPSLGVGVGLPLAESTRGGTGGCGPQTPGDAGRGRAPRGDRVVSPAQGRHLLL